MASKKVVRATITERIHSIPRETRRQADRQICERIAASFLREETDAMLAYFALRDEVNVDAAMRAAADRGIPVYAPAVAEAASSEATVSTGAAASIGAEIVFRAVDPVLHLAAREPRESRAPLQRHRLGMLEPPPDAPAWNPGRGRTVVLCPGRAFSLEGHRLGRGGGFYDRFLASLRLESVARAQMLVVGVCYEVQLLREVPMNDHDQRMDAVVTEDRRISTISV